MKHRKLNRKLVAYTLSAVMALGNVSVVLANEADAQNQEETMIQSAEVPAEAPSEQQIAAEIPEEPAAEPAVAAEPKPEPIAEVQEPAVPESAQEIQKPAEPAPEAQKPAEPESTQEVSKPAEPETQKPTEGEPIKEETEEEKPVEETTEEESEAEEQPVQNEATKLIQSVYDDAGRVVTTVTAEIQEASFDAETADIEMEVHVLTEAEEKYLQGLMKEKLPENTELGEYVLYDVAFKVNGEITVPKKEIKLTYSNTGLDIQDTKCAHVFYYDAADPEIPGDKDEVTEITQRTALIEYLQNAGRSVENVDDNDLSEISLNADGKAEQIQMEVRESTIYGCYVEKEPELAEKAELTYENDEVLIKVEAVDENAIPENTSLKVVPILKDKEETKTQYEEVETKIQEKAAEDQYEIAGFLAYDITFADEEGNKVEPNGNVNVSMEYKKAALPENVQEEDVKEADVTVLHLEENENGEVQNVVDMNESQQLKEMKTTEKQKVEKVELQTDSFSVYTITWKSNTNGDGGSKIYIHYVDENGNPVDGKTGSGGFTSSTWQNVDQWKEEVAGLEYKKAYILENNVKKDVTQVYREYSTSGGRNPTTTVTLKYRNGSSGNGTTWTSTKADVNGQQQNGYHLYLVYAPKTPINPPSTDGGSSATGSLAHRKYIKDNGDGTYDLTLDVRGAVGTETNPAKVDVVLVMDISWSMNGNNMTSAIGAVNSLVDALADQNIDSKWKLVTFSVNAATRTANWVDRNNIKNTVAGLQPTMQNDSGTNYEAGLKKAATELTTARDGAEKIVIFLTDGQPNHYLDNNGKVQAGNSGANTTQAAYNGAIRGAEAITCNRFYAVGMQLNNNIGFNGMTGLQLLQDVKDKTNASYKQANNVNNADLSSMFTQIAEDITTYEASNVTIIDKLTNAVDIVTKTDEVIPADDLRVRVMHGNTDVTDAEVNAGRIVASYDNQSKELKLDFNDNYKLKADYTYSVTVTIKPNQNALNAYVNNNSSYPDTGEEDTGASSAGKRGIFSNVDNSAYVTWDRMKNNDVVSEGNSGAYNRPVVQIKMLNVTKTFENEEVANNIKNKTTNPYNIKITGDFTAGKQDSPVTVTKQLTDSDVVETVDQVTGEVTYTWPPLLIFGFSDSTHNQNNLYTISEENYNTTDDSNWKYDSTSWNAIGGQITPDTDISTMITTSANYISIPDVNKPEKAPEYTVNCINHYVEKVDLDLVKTSEHTNAQIDGAEFKLYKGTETSVGDTTGIDWTAKQQVGNTIIVNQLNEEPEIKGLDDGYYELVETKAPSSHSLLATSIYFKVSGGVISLCDKDGNGIENQDMWSLAISDGNVLTVKNAVLYDLPSTGGRGIFWYLISGTLLMMAGALILYRNKHGEVLRG